MMKKKSDTEQRGRTRFVLMRPLYNFKFPKVGDLRYCTTYVAVIVCDDEKKVIPSRGLVSCS
jgi:hypothetical protein